MIMTATLSNDCTYKSRYSPSFLGSVEMNALKAVMMRCRPEKRAEESTSCCESMVPRVELVEFFHDGGDGVGVASSAPLSLNLDKASWSQHMRTTQARASRMRERGRASLLR